MFPMLAMSSSSGWPDCEAKYTQTAAFMHEKGPCESFFFWATLPLLARPLTLSVDELRIGELRIARVLRGSTANLSTFERK